MDSAKETGFTLIELSIVLVIIGLIVGGVLAGQDLIRAAGARAVISQIEKYNTAVNTFRGKYGYLPGDIPDPGASKFGFQARGTLPGQGDGNGIITGYGNGGASGWIEDGENIVFWVDLSKAGLIDGGFSTATASSIPAVDATGSLIDKYLPRAKIGNGLYVYSINLTYTGSSGGGWYNANPVFVNQNFFAISQVTDIGFSQGQDDAEICCGSTGGIPVNQAYNIDKKMDDGLPLSGNVMAAGSMTTGGDGDIYWANGDIDAIATTASPGSSAISASSSTCYDNGHNASKTTNYSVLQNNGAAPNCALIFRVQ